MNVKEMVKLVDDMEPSYFEFKIRRRSEFPKIQIPNIRRDVEDVRRLMNRLPTADVEGSESCDICRFNDHVYLYCPCLEKIGESVVLGPYFDSICLGCGKIGETCCSMGAYAVPKRCIGCMSLGHWYWERKCMRGWVKRWADPLPSIDGVQPPPSPHENYVSDDEVVYYPDERGSEDEEVTFTTDKDNIQNKEEDTLIASPEVSSADKSYLISKSESSQQKRGKSRRKSRRKRKQHRLECIQKKNIVGAIKKLGS